jgi:hypothetical protein
MEAEEQITFQKMGLKEVTDFVLELSGLTKTMAPLWFFLPFYGICCPHSSSPSFPECPRSSLFFLS